jgi:hypothetical protein
MVRKECSHKHCLPPSPGRVELGPVSTAKAMPRHVSENKLECTANLQSGKAHIRQGWVKDEDVFHRYPIYQDRASVVDRRPHCSYLRSSRPQLHALLISSIGLTCFWCILMHGRLAHDSGRLLECYGEEHAPWPCTVTVEQQRYLITELKGTGERFVAGPR